MARGVGRFARHSDGRRRRVERTAACSRFGAARNGSRAARDEIIENIGACKECRMGKGGTLCWWEFGVYKNFCTARRLFDRRLRYSACVRQAIAALPRRARDDLDIYVNFSCLD